MPFDIAAIGQNAAMQTAGTGLSYLAAELNHGQQLRHQSDFQKQQIQGQQEMGKYNQALALETWEKTSYPAQVEQMKKAGLNPGLMYGQAGSGGTTNFGGSGSITGGQAPNNNGMGIQAAAQLALLNAQTENIKADTKNKISQSNLADTTIPNVEANTELTIAKTANENVNNVILGWEATQKAITTDISAATKEAKIKELIAQSNKVVSEATIAANNKEISDATKDEVIKQVEIKTTESALNVAAIKAGIDKTVMETAKSQQEIKNLAAEIQQKWFALKLEKEQNQQRGIGLQLEGLRTEIQNKLAKFTTSTPQQIKQWTGIFLEFISAVSGGLRGAGALIP